MAKMIDVRPETFLQGLGQYSYDDMMNLGRFNGTAQGVLMGLSGLGTLAQVAVGQPKSVMNAIIKNANEMNAKMAASQRAKIEMAKKNPIAAVAIAKKVAQTSMPGANETRGIQQALNMAAKKAQQAKKEEQAAKVLLSQDDKRGAAAKAVNAMTLAREAAIKANSAEKSRITRALDILANTLKAQADFIDGMIHPRVAYKGDTAQTMALAATAQSLREQVKRLQAQSAVVAASSVVPPNAPTQQRIADLANKFNIRTAAENKFAMNRAVVSVLADLSENPMAQVKDYSGAISYYGPDAAGYVMADMEFGNYGRALKGLAHAVHGIGYFDTTSTLAQADAVINAGLTVANKTYAQVIVPNAGGLGGLRGPQGLPGKCNWFEPEPDCIKRLTKWNNWCTTTYSGNQEQIKKCQNPPDVLGCPALEPWSATGKTCRGNQTIAQAALQVGTDIASGKILPGGGAPTPPSGGGTTATGGGAVTGGEAATGTGSSAMTVKEDNTMLYASIAGGVLVLVGAGWYFLVRKPSA